MVSFQKYLQFILPAFTSFNHSSEITIYTNLCFICLVHFTTYKWRQLTIQNLSSSIFTQRGCHERYDDMIPTDPNGAKRHLAPLDASPSKVSTKWSPVTSGDTYGAVTFSSSSVRWGRDKSMDSMGFSSWIDFWIEGQSDNYIYKYIQWVY